MANASYDVPLELQEEILARLPLKSLLKFTCVSKKWASVIGGKQFSKLYLAQSMKRPRVLFTFGRRLSDPTQEVLFHSVYQEEKPLLSTGVQQMRISSEHMYAFSAPIRGLVCLGSETTIMVCNPGTKKFLTLPPIRSFNRSSFGYDQEMNVFKVLCMTSSTLHGGSRGPTHHVFTVGLAEESWRPIVCKHRYCQVTNALYDDGVLYYGAWSHPQNKSILMSFNVRSEEFDVSEFPEGVKVQIGAKLVNYNREIALVRYTRMELYDNGEFQLWVRNESSGEWREERVVIPRWREIAGDKEYAFEGTTGSGELVFGQHWLLEGSHFVLYYNTFNQSFREFEIEGDVGGSFHYAQTFLNHVDSLLLM